MRTPRRASALTAGLITSAVVAASLAIGLPAVADDAVAPALETLSTAPSDESPAVDPIVEEPDAQTPELGALARPEAQQFALAAVAPQVVDIAQVYQVKEGGRIAVTLTFDVPVSGLGQGWNGSGTTYTKIFYTSRTVTVDFVDGSNTAGQYTFTVDKTAPVVVPPPVQVYQDKEGGRVSVTLTFSEPVTGLGQGWYGSGTTYTKAYYRSKTDTITFTDLVGNPGSYVLQVVYTPPPTPPVCPTTNIAVSDANYTSVFPRRDPDNFDSVPASDGLGTAAFEATGVRFTLPEDRSRVRWLHPVDLALDCLGMPSLVQTGNPAGGSAQAVVDLDGDGTSDGGLYTDGGYEWTAEGQLQGWLDAHGSPAALLTNTTGKYTGTAGEWLAVFPDADIDEIGVGAGRWAKGSALFSSVSVAGTTFTFAASAPAVEPVTDAPTGLAPAGLIAHVGDPASWNPVAHAAIYQTRIAATEAELAGSTAFGPFACTESAGRCTLAGYPIPDGTWHWQVRGLATDGTPGPWSAVTVVTVDTTAPAVPTNLRPADGSFTNAAQFDLTWDAVADAASYIVQSSATPDFATLIGEATVTSPKLPIPEIQTPPLPSAPEAVYYWRVRAVDAAGNSSAWTSATKLTVDRTRPDITIDVPAAGAVLNGDVTVTVTGLDANGLNYLAANLYAASNTGEALRPIGRSVANGATSHSASWTIPISWFTADGTYTIRAGGFDVASNNRTVTAQFTIDRTGPAAPQPINPENGATKANATPTLDWQPVADAVSYQVRLSTSPGRTPNQNDGELNGSDATTVAAATDALVLGPQTQGWHWWQVRGIDALGNVGPWSNIWAFGVDTVAPAVSLVSPADGATLASGDFTLEWTAPESGLTYEVRSSIESAVDPVTGELLGTTGGGTASVTTNSLALVGVPEQTYYWQVRAIDALGNVGPWTSPRSVTVDLPTLAVPGDDEGDGGTSGGTTGGTTPNTSGRPGTTSGTTPQETTDLTTFALPVTEQEDEGDDTSATGGAPEARDGIDVEPASATGPDAGLLALLVGLAAAVLLLLIVFLAWLRRRQSEA